MRWNRASHCEIDKKSMETETTTWSEFPNGGKAIAEQTPASKKKKKKVQNSKTGRITVWDPSREVNHLSMVMWDRKIITEFTSSISSTRIGKPVCMRDINVSEDKNISRWVDREKLIYVRWNRIKNLGQGQRTVIPWKNVHGHHFPKCSRLFLFL